ncbi:MAG: hypothetical protein K8F92_10895 [Hyphomicrobium sp.]|nr:MAG: hypothetical protein F9K20_04175 [Hyphomicrobium sp.]MBZ0210145.1 hypothetical protein [Hyphomicrobium sp.]
MNEAITIFGAIFTAASIALSLNTKRFAAPHVLRNMFRGHRGQWVFQKALLSCGLVVSTEPISRLIGFSYGCCGYVTLHLSDSLYLLLLRVSLFLWYSHVTLLGHAPRHHILCGPLMFYIFGDSC